MKFDRLNSSIKLNANESPSLYMALCLIESMFKDVEDVSGTDISQLEIGDEQLPTKLIWLSRKLLKIYSENTERFERNRSRLDDIMEKLRKSAGELEKLGDSAMEYNRLHEQEEALEKELREANERKNESERLRALCEERRKELEALKQFDPESVRQELNELDSEKQELSARYSSVQNELSALRSSVKELELKTVEEKRSFMLEKDKLDQLNSEKLVCEEERMKLREALAAVQNALASGNEERDREIADRAYYEHKLSELNKEIEDYRNDIIAPLKKEIEEQDALCNLIKSNLDGLKAERENAVFRTAQLNRQIEDARLASEAKKEELKKKLEEIDFTSGELELVKAEISAETDRLASLQTEMDELKNTRLPQIRLLAEENEKENNELNSAVRGLNQRSNELVKQNEKLKADEEELTKRIDELTLTRAELTASYDAKNEALSELSKNVEALRGKNDREKEQQYRRQLEEEQEKLIELGNTCTELEQRISELKAEGESRQRRVETLKAQKAGMDETNRKISQLIQELAPYGNNDFMSRVNVLQQRQRFMEETRRGMITAVDLLSSAFSSPSDAFPGSLETLGDTLQRCGKGLDRLQDELIRCANAVKASEKSEERL